MTRVLVFGTFDPLHDGHRQFLEQAATLGDEVMVVAARDSYIRSVKGREPRVPARERLAALAALPIVKEALWGDEWPSVEPYRMLHDLTFDVVALGYDQAPTDEIVHSLLAQYKKPQIRVVRLRPYQPDLFKSSLLTL